MTRALDIGCGALPKNPFDADEVLGIDLYDNNDNSVIGVDLAVHPIPFPDHSFDYITALDFIEHVPRVIYAPVRRNCFVELMSEIWRTLKLGGVSLFYTPAYPHASAFQDPTHVNYITAETFPIYFSENPAAQIYGFKGAFRILQQGFVNEHLFSLLQAVERGDQSMDRSLAYSVRWEAGPLSQPILKARKVD